MRSVSQHCLLKALLAKTVIRHHLFEQSAKSAPVISMYEVAKLMRDHVVDAGLRRLDQVP